MMWTLRKKIPPRRQHLPGTMNKTESRYAELLEIQKRSGEIVEWRFEAIKFILAPNTSYTPDFQVIYEDRIEFHEIKGFMREDAICKFKGVAAKFPEFAWRMIKLEKNQWITVFDL